jgi:hypothetical protein
MASSHALREGVEKGGATIIVDMKREKQHRVCSRWKQD